LSILGGWPAIRPPAQHEHAPIGITMHLTNARSSSMTEHRQPARPSRSARGGDCGAMFGSGAGGAVHSIAVGVAAVRRAAVLAPGGVPNGGNCWWRRGVVRSRQSMASAPVVMRSGRPAVNSAWVPPPPGEAELPQFCGGTMRRYRGPARPAGQGLITGTDAGSGGRAGAAYQRYHRTRHVCAIRPRACLPSVAGLNGVAA
jgi:hypothetical protein